MFPPPPVRGGGGFHGRGRISQKKSLAGPPPPPTNPPKPGGDAPPPVVPSVLDVSPIDFLENTKNVFSPAIEGTFQRKLFEIVMFVRPPPGEAVIFRPGRGDLDKNHFLSLPQEFPRPEFSPSLPRTLGAAPERAPSHM